MKNLARAPHLFISTRVAPPLLVAFAAIVVLLACLQPAGAQTTPTFTISDATVVEGNSGTTNATFTVTKIGVNTSPITIQYATADGSATVADGDYEAQSGGLTFATEDTTKPITIAVNGDTKFEPTEIFFVNLSGSANFTNPTGNGTITNDDNQPTISISDVTQAEGTGANSDFNFTVTLSNPSYQTVTVDYSTADGTATAPSDYIVQSGTVTFAPGETTKTITVQVVGDSVDEPNETFTVNLSNPKNATIADGSGTGTIQDDDSNAVFSIDNVIMTEGDSGTKTFTFTVAKSGTTFKQSTVTYTTRDGSATTADADYVAKSGTLTFTASQTSQPITVTVNGDTKNEDDEQFYVDLTGAANGSIDPAQATGTGTILNDDAQISINDVSQAEGNQRDDELCF